MYLRSTWLHAGATRTQAHCACATILPVASTAIFTRTHATWRSASAWCTTRSAHPMTRRTTWALSRTTLVILLWLISSPVMTWTRLSHITRCARHHHHQRGAGTGHAAEHVPAGG